MYSQRAAVIYYVGEQAMADNQTVINTDDVDESVTYEERCLCKILLGRPVNVRSLEMKIKIKEIKQVTRICALEARSRCA